MRELYKNLEAVARAEGAAAYRFCLLLTVRPRKAEQAAFQSFLCLAEESGPLSAGEERRRLYRALLRASEDTWYRKGSAPLKKEAFEELTGAAPGDALWRLMKRPLRRKAAAFLVYGARFSAEDAAAVLGVRRGRVEKWLAAERDAREAVAALGAFAPESAWEEQLGDNVLMRWQERNVPLENALLRFRSVADRLVPYLALAVLLLCAAAVWYTAQLA